MANAEMKIFEAEKLHQPMIAAVSIIPNMPLKWTRRKQEVNKVLLNVQLYVKLLLNIKKCHVLKHRYIQVQLCPEENIDYLKVAQ